MYGLKPVPFKLTHYRNGRYHQFPVCPSLGRNPVISSESFFLDLPFMGCSLRILYFDSSRGKNREKAVPLLPGRMVLDTRRSACRRSTS
jgi:hypothetical protein